MNRFMNTSVVLTYDPNLINGLVKLKTWDHDILPMDAQILLMQAAISEEPVRIESLSEESQLKRLQAIDNAAAEVQARYPEKFK